MVWSTMWKMLDRGTCRAVQCARKLQRPNGKIIPPFSEQPLAKNITQHKPSHIHSDRAEFYTQGLNQSNSEVPASFEAQCAFLVDRSLLVRGGASNTYLKQ